MGIAGWVLDAAESAEIDARRWRHAQTELQEVVSSTAAAAAAEWSSHAAEAFRAACADRIAEIEALVLLAYEAEAAVLDHVRALREVADSLPELLDPSTGLLDGLPGASELPRSADLPGLTDLRDLLQSPDLTSGLPSLPDTFSADGGGGR